MSVAAYITEYNKKIDERIANLNAKIEANDNKGALDTLASIRTSEPESAIAKAYDDNGVLINPSLKSATYAQDKNLAKRLTNIHRYQARLEKAESDKSKDHGKELKNSYSKFISEFGAEPVALGGESQVDALLNGDVDDFEEIYDDNSPVGLEVIQAAFKEMRSGAEIPEEIEEESSAINANVETEVPEEDEETEAPVEETPAETGVTSEPTTLPEEKSPEIPDSVLLKDEIESEAETAVVSETSNITNVINEAPVEETKTTSTPDTVTPASPINNEPKKNKKRGGLGGFLNKAKEKLQVLSETGDLTQVFKGSEGDNVDTRTSNAINDNSNYDIWGNPTNETSETAIDNSSINDASSTVSGSNTKKVDASVTNESSTTVNTNLSSPTSKSIETSETSKVSNFNAPEIAKLGPSPEPVTNESIKNLGDTITANNISTPNQAPSEITKGVELTPTKKETPNTTPSISPSGESIDAAPSNAQLASALSGMAKELKSIKSLLQGPLNVKIKNR